MGWRDAWWTVEFLGMIAALVFGAFMLGWWLLTRTVSRTWRFRVSIGAFAILNGAASLLAYRYYQSLLDYCEPENRATGGSGLDCLEPYNWFAINGMGLLWLMAAAVLAALVVASYRAGRKVDQEG